MRLYRGALNIRSGVAFVPRSSNEAVSSCSSVALLSGVPSSIDRPRDSYKYIGLSTNGCKLHSLLDMLVSYL